MQLNEIIEALYAGENIIIVGGAGAGKTHLLNQIKKSLIEDNNPTAILAGKGNQSYLSKSKNDFCEILEEIKDIDYKVKHIILMDQEDKHWLDDFTFLDNLQADINYVATIQAGSGPRLKDVIANKNVSKYFSKIIVCGYNRTQEFIIIEKKCDCSFDWSDYDRFYAQLSNV